MMTTTAGGLLNPIQAEPAIWNGRWHALEQNMTDVLTPLNDKEEKAGWEITLASTLACLQAFGKKQFCFFQNGFQNGRLVDSPRLKAEYAIRQTLDQISFDLAALRKVQSQRHPDLSTPRERQTLQLADQLAYRALQPAIDAGLVYITTALTYFQKATHVRVIPYAPVALIGIPYTCTGIYDAGAELVPNSPDSTHTARDFLAIAHEIGHHLFWHGKQENIPLRSLLRSRLSSRPTWRMAWLEEVFADIYGAMIAGPVLALDFQELIYDNPDLEEDDGEHPVGASRPFVYIDALKRIKDKDGKLKYAHSPSALEEKWKASREKRDKMDSFRPKKGDTSAAVSLDEARLDLHEVIEAILELLQPMEAARQDETWSADSADPDINLYQTFRDEVLTQPNGTPPTFQSKPPGSGLEEVTLVDDNIIAWEEGKPLVKWFSFFAEASEHSLTLLPETWNNLLVGGGWAAGGPEGDPNPG
jgi:hypothetical protein